MARTAVVTGAGQGVGRAVALRLAHAGHRVALIGRDEAKLRAVADELPGPSLCIGADLVRPDSLRDAFGTVGQRWGAPEILVANAGAGMAKPLAETDDEDWDAMLAINLTAPFRCLREVLPAMVTNGWGRVVVIASVVAKRGERQVSAYAASKHGALGLVRAAAAEVARSGVTVNAVCPGYVDTPMTEATIRAISERRAIPTGEAAEILARRQPIGRLVTPDEVAAAVLACVDNAAINGQGINVDGGAVQS